MDYPYLPEGRTIEYAPGDNRYIQIAHIIRNQSNCVKQRTGAIVVTPEGLIAGIGNNTTQVVPENGICPRDLAGFGTGEGYELCHSVCQQNGKHAEQVAVAAAGKHALGGTLYLYGHWWCCKGCWDAMIASGISRVVLLEKASAETIWE